MLDSAHLKNIFRTSFNKLLDYDSQNITDGVSERNLCGRLAIYIENKLKKDLYNKYRAYNYNGTYYYADVEYNRMQDRKIKCIINQEEKLIKVVCDLILHSRGQSKNDNLIAIEMKKSTSTNKNKDKDKDRLKALTSNPESSDNIYSYDGTDINHICGYALGYYIEFNLRNNTYLIEEYINGAIVNSYNHHLHEKI